MSANSELLWYLILHLALTGLPAVAAALVGARLRIRSVPVLLALALAASGTTALLSFWTYYLDPTVGEAWGFLVVFGSIQAIVLAAYRGGLERELLARLAIPFVLWTLASVFIVYLGFLHGGFDQGIPMSATRFSHQLPSDNDIPRFFAEWFALHGNGASPPLYNGEWLMSDRPPLQIGYVLSQQPFVEAIREPQYQVLCVVVQQLWVIGIWAVLLAARLRPATRSLAMFAAFVSDIVIVHGFFVWPKLIAAAFAFAAFALVISDDWSRLRRDWRVAALIGALLALAYLAHGSSVYAIVPLAGLALLRAAPSWRWAAVVAVVGLGLLAPWSAYQRFDEPPGNYLLKWHLGGQIERDERGTVEAIVDGYTDAGVGGMVENKLNNFDEIVGANRVEDAIGESLDAMGEGDVGEVIRDIRHVRFYSLLPALGLLLLAPIAMFLGRNRSRDEREWRFAIVCFGFTVAAAVVWALIQFGTEDSQTSLQSGSLAIPLLAMVGAVAGLRAIHPRLALALVAINTATVLALYAPSLDPPPGTVYSASGALAAAIALVGFAFVCRRSATGDDPARQ